MKYVLFFIEAETINRTIQFERFSAGLSHDKHLYRLIKILLNNNYVVHVTSTEICAPNQKVFKIEVDGTITPGSENLIASNFKYYAVFCAYIDKVLPEFFPGAKNIAYMAGLYFTEMPEHFLSGKFFYTLNSIQRRLNGLIFQNPRQYELMQIFCKALAGTEISKISSILPLLPVDFINFKKADKDYKISRKITRQNYGILDRDIVLINGGGAWRWTDYSRFLDDFILYCRNNKSSNIKLIIPGLGQPSNPDHSSYIDTIINKLSNNEDLLFKNKESAWKILYLPDWNDAGRLIEKLYDCADIGVSVNPSSLENYLSNRVRVYDYIERGLGLLISSGTIIDSLDDTDEVIYTANPVVEKCYYQALEKIEKCGKRREYYMKCWSEILNSLPPEYRYEDQFLEFVESTSVPAKINECPINYVVHDEKIEVLKRAHFSFIEKFLD